MTEFAIFEYLDAGGNLALFALVYIMWKFDRRLLQLEITMARVLKDNRRDETTQQ